MITGGKAVEGASLRKILLADDEPDVLEVSRIALESVGGYEVVACSSGEELLARLADFEPDLVIIDVVMPDMAGLEVLKALRQVNGYADTPVVFLTGVIHGGELAALRDSGAVDVIRKPFNPMTLAERLKEIWGALDGQ
jgi:CheY-like chemotaxis protein